MLIIPTISTAVNCPDLSGTYFYEKGSHYITLKIKTTFENGKAHYDFERSNGDTPWIWSTIADGKSYKKELCAMPKLTCDDYTNVKEVATCKNGKLHRSFTGDWINSDDLVPFDVESDMSSPTPGVIHWHSDFSGYGIKHLITEEDYQQI